MGRTGQLVDGLEVLRPRGLTALQENACTVASHTLLCLAPVGARRGPLVFKPFKGTSQKMKMTHMTSKAGNGSLRATGICEDSPQIELIPENSKLPPQILRLCGSWCRKQKRCASYRQAAPRGRTGGICTKQVELFSSAHWHPDLGVNRACT